MRTSKPVMPLDLPFLTTHILSSAQSNAQRNLGKAQTFNKEGLFRHETRKPSCKLRWKVSCARTYQGHRTEIDLLDPLIVNYLVD